MKSLRFLCAFTLFLTNNSIAADESTQTSQQSSQATQQAPQEAHDPTPFDLIKILIDTLETDIVQETSIAKDFDFFQYQNNEVEKLLQKLKDTNKLVIKSIEDEKFDAEKNYKKLVDQAKKEISNELNQAKKSYENSCSTHSANVKNMTIDNTDNAVDEFTATDIAQFKITLAMLKEKLSTKLQQLANNHAYNLEVIENKQESLLKKYSDTINHYNNMVATLNNEEKKALINAQIEHIQCLKQREFDETYSTATYPTVWSGVGSMVSSTPYSYRANKNGIECDGCIQPNGTFIHTNLKKEMEACQSPQAVQSLAMIVWALKKEQAQEGTDYQIGIQSCRLEGNKLLCKTMRDAYKKALEEWKQQFQDKEDDKTNCKKIKEEYKKAIAESKQQADDKEKAN